MQVYKTVFYFNGYKLLMKILFNLFKIQTKEEVHSLYKSRRNWAKWITNGKYESKYGK